MTFQQLQYILEIGKTGSVSGAAKNLFVSSSSVSISLNALEKELGCPLFTRTQKGLVPTESGKQVLDYANQICRTHALLNKVGAEAVRTLRINCTDQAPVAKAFGQLLWENKDRTDLRIENISLASDEIYQKLVSHEIELSLSSSISFSIGAWEKKLRKGGLHRQMLKTVPAVIQVGPGHRLYEAEKITPYDLHDDHFIDNPHNSLARNQAFSSNIYVDPNKILYIAKAGIRREALMRGLGFDIGVLPPKGTVSPIRSIPLEGCFFHFSAVTNTQTPAQPEIMRLLQLTRENLDEAYPDY